MDGKIEGNEIGAKGRLFTVELASVVVRVNDYSNFTHLYTLFSKNFRIYSTNFSDTYGVSVAVPYVYLLPLLSLVGHFSMYVSHFH